MNQEIIIRYKIFDNKKTNIFGEQFIKNNKNNCKIIIDNEIKELTEFYFDEKEKKEELEVKLIINFKLTDISYMFSKCESLISISNEISNLDTSEVTNMMGIFSDCKSLSSLPDLSKWNTKNVTNMSFTFFFVSHYYLYQIFQNGIHQMLLKCIQHLEIAKIYIVYLIFQNGIFLMLNS